MNKAVGIGDFLMKRNTIPVIDVRSPAEYRKGHVPGAVNLPLFTDEERMLVGKTYHLRGREEAVREGLKAVGPKLDAFLENTREAINGKDVMLYCWRGGMRSASFAFLLETAGFNTATLAGGYKQYRQNVLASFRNSYHFVVLGGKTGSGKTEILRELRQAGCQVIDLEGLANHKGSAYGHIGQHSQPSTEHFENLLADQLRKLDHAQPCLIEDESMTIGRVFLPGDIYRQMKASPLLCLEMPAELRVGRLLNDYAGCTLDLILATEGIRKRLGNDRRKKVVELLEAERLEEAATAILEYYDKSYAYDLQSRAAESITVVRTDTPDAAINAGIIREAMKSLRLPENTESIPE
ncbi:MAG TPA: tRNA 2-selenouridine(34) synthase MnmH [Bacteroidales bacterium]|nr:tRNA 2-selenouridine(34) synthase MnmH [Bacteroidales bacterium]HSA43016.1 tRNA 2-selenouridine(34) synthase MnmH [Bacteroidales bacterium]